MSRVALLIPVYNNQDGLERSLASLTGEVPLDIVVVDDGSTPPHPAPRGSPSPQGLPPPPGGEQGDRARPEPWSGLDSGKRI